MRFINEKTAINGLADTVIKSGVSLYNAVKYIYAMTDEDFYNVSIKDCLKVVLNNITDSECLKALGLRISEKTCSEMSGPEYNRILSLMVFSFAVRIPTLKNIMIGGDSMTDDQIYQLYSAIVAKGAANYNEIIKESYLETKYLVKKNKPVPPYNAEWYKAYIMANVPKLAEINNRNMFLMGSVDMLFAMFYSCMEEELKNRLSEYVNDTPV